MIPQTVAGQTPLSMGVSRQKYWSGLPFPSPGDLPDPRIEPESPALQADSLPQSHLGNPHTTLDLSQNVLGAFVFIICVCVCVCVCE